jgi:hypothetical protein
LHAEELLSAPTPGALRAAYLYVKRSKKVFELRPRQPCTLCGSAVPYGPARYCVCECLASGNQLPLAHICVSCPTTEFSVLGYRFGLSEPGPNGRRTLSPGPETLSPGHANVRGPDTLWTVRARLGLAVARAVFRSHRQEEAPPVDSASVDSASVDSASVDSASVDSASVDALSPFAAALVSALRDMKLCRLVVDRLAFSPLSLCSTPRQASRSLSLLVTIPACPIDTAFSARTAECDWRHSARVV